MITNVRAALAAIVGNAAILREARGAGRMFELYLMTGIGVALQARSYEVWIQRSDGTRVWHADPDRRFIQRGGRPAGIPSAAGGASDASSIVFRKDPHSDHWALLNGIQFTGRSTAKHEIDLAIIPETVAQTLRSYPSGGSPLGRPRVAIECKDVQKPGSMDETRAFIARLYDLTLLESHHPHLRRRPRLPVTGLKAIHPNAPPGGHHTPAKTYWDENRRTFNALARRGGFAVGTAPLTVYHAVEPHGQIAAGSPAAIDLMDAIADWIAANGY